MRQTSRPEPARGVVWSRGAACALVLAVVVYGVWLRFDGLDRKVVWNDEAGTFLHLSGHGEAEIAALHDGEARPVGVLLDTFQRGDGAFDRVVATAAIEEPQIGGWYALARLWSGFGGTDAVAWTRTLSALASTLSLVLLHLVARRLCMRPAAAALVVGLAAVSPLQIRYAQEARSYALWGALLLAAALVLMRARERGGIGPWSAFAALLAASLWTQPLSLLLILPLAILVLVPGPDAPAAGSSRGRAPRSAPLAPFAAATCAALLAWLPWAWVIAANRGAASQTTGWSGVSPGALARARAWLGVLTSVFFRPGGEGGLLSGLASSSSAAVLALWSALGLAVLVLVALALDHLWRNEGARTRGFLLALAAVPFASLAAADLVLGGRRSTVDRYLLPSWIALELIVAIYLTAAVTATTSRRRALVALALLALGAATAARTRPLPVWWNTEPEGLRELIAVGNRLGGRDDVVIVTDLPPLPMLQLAHRLDRDARLRLGPAAATAIGADEWPRVALVQPSDELLDAVRLSAGAERRVVREGDGLPIWRVATRGG